MDLDPSCELPIGQLFLPLLCVRCLEIDIFSRSRNQKFISGMLSHIPFVPFLPFLSPLFTPPEVAPQIQLRDLGSAVTTTFTATRHAS